VSNRFAIRSFGTSDTIALPAAATGDGSGLLIAGNALLLVAFGLHAGVDGTHDWSGPTGLPIQLWVAAITLGAIIMVALALSLHRDRRAPAAAIFAGFTASAGGLAAHVAPPWGPLSQFSFWAAKTHADTLSWVLLACLFGIGLWVVAVGIKAMAAATGPASTDAIASVARQSGSGGSR
jgi:hypothetical protein